MQQKLCGRMGKMEKEVVMDFNTLFRSFWFYNNQPRLRHSLSMKMLPSLAIIDSSMLRLTWQCRTSPPPMMTAFSGWTYNIEIIRQILSQKQIFYTILSQSPALSKVRPDLSFPSICNFCLSESALHQFSGLALMSPEQRALNILFRQKIQFD